MGWGERRRALAVSSLDDPMIAPAVAAQSIRDTSFDWRRIPQPDDVPPAISEGPSAWQDEIVSSGGAPAPAEVIADLDLVDVTWGPRGPSVPARVRKRELDKMAIECIDAGRPFVYHGRRFPGVDG